MYDYVQVASVVCLSLASRPIACQLPKVSFNVGHFGSRRQGDITVDGFVSLMLRVMESPGTKVRDPVDQGGVELLCVLACSVRLAGRIRLILTILPG